VIDGRFRIVGALGAGAMGTVLDAEHVPLGRRVALKVLQERVGDDPSMRMRFEREAKTLAAMQHPNIVSIVDYGVWEGVPFLVMERLEGRTLRDLIDRESPLPFSRIVAIEKQILRAIGYAHERGVVHRDLKPGNVFLQALPDHPDHVKILDFGFAKFLTTPQASMVSAEGTVLGTPAYMAPEQVTASTVDARTDVYAAAVLLFEMITGDRPFEGEVADILRRRVQNDAPLLSEVRPDLFIHEDLDRHVARALARPPEARFSSASAFAAALDGLPPDPVRPRAAGEATEVAPKKLPPEIEISMGSLEARSPSPAPVHSRRGGRAWAGLVVVALLVGVGLVLRWPGEVTPPVSVVEGPEREAAEEESEDEPESESGAEPEPGAESATPELEVTAPEIEEDAEASVLPPDPWASPDVPPELATFRARFEAREPTDTDLQRVAGYARNHLIEVRAILLLGQGYAARSWLTLALDRYDQAYEMDPLSRGDPRMLETLVRLSASPVVGERAADMVTTMYGEEALPTIEDARRTANDTRELGRFTALRDRIAD
jgi:predicted Ser/Thr protein kinase